MDNEKIMEQMECLQKLIPFEALLSAREQALAEQRDIIFSHTPFTIFDAPVNITIRFEFRKPVSIDKNGDGG